MENPMQVTMVQTEQEKQYQPFLDALLAGEVSFEYLKKDGTTRQAKGTLCLDLIPDSQKSTEKKEMNHTQNYYDIDAADWRCFIKNNFIDYKKQAQ